MSRYYTQENASNKVVYSDQRNKSAGYLSSDITLHHLYIRLLYGQSLKDIRSDFAGIQRSRLLLARAFFYACNPTAYMSRNTQRLKVLVDENIDEHIVTDATRRAFGHATHVSFEGLADSKDIDLWKYAVKNQFNLVVSKDRARVPSRQTKDLTLCAETSWNHRLKTHGWQAHTSLERLPRILHIMDGSLGGQDIANLLIEKKSKVMELFEEASSPSIQVSCDKVKPGKNILEFVAEGQFEKLRKQRDAIVCALLEDYGIEQKVAAYEDKNDRKLKREIAAQLKRIAEHEMLEQLIARKGQMLRNDDLLRKVKSVMQLATTHDKSTDSFDVILDGYKSRGIGSVMAPANRALVA